MSQYEKEESSDRYSLRGKVFHQLREDILSGHYKEHEELREMAISEGDGRFPHARPGSAAPTGTGRPGQHYPEQGGICDRHHQKGRGGYLCDPFFAGRALCPLGNRVYYGKTAGCAGRKYLPVRISRQQRTCPEADGAGRSVPRYFI